MRKKYQTRLFVAASLPNQTKKELIAIQRGIKDQSERCSITKSENLHLTLAFIGEVGPRDFSKVKHFFSSLPDLKDTFKAIQPMLGSFNTRDGKLVWAGVKVEDQFHTFVKDLRSQLIDRGISVDTKVWKPHITLSRRTQGLDLNQLRQEHAKTLNNFEICRIDLFQSEFTPQGMRYTSLDHIKLGKNYN